MDSGWWERRPWWTNWAFSAGVGLVTICAAALTQTMLVAGLIAGFVLLAVAAFGVAVHFVRQYLTKPEPPRGPAPVGIRTPSKPLPPTWYELEQRFKDLEPALQYSRIDGQTGAAGEHWRIAGGASRDVQNRFNAVASLASLRLALDFPQKVQEHSKIADEPDLAIRWYKALQYLAGRYEHGLILEQTHDDGSSGGFLITGTIYKPAEASATLCLEMAAQATQV
jgi:hypothetical protein